MREKGEWKTYEGRSIVLGDAGSSGTDVSMPEPMVRGMTMRRMLPDPGNSTRKNSVY